MRVLCEKRTLDNGLDVIVHEDQNCPIVAVNLWYHVGSKNERPGLTGFAHLFEHLMFEGSAHHDSGYFQPLQEAGGALNGSTNADRTNYWQTVPTSAIDRALWMESDRMGYLLPALTREKFDTQRQVVLNERRQNYENRPYGLATMVVMATLYPPEHPYHWMTIGAPEDLRAASLDAVRQFFETYYHPGNASLTLAGAIAPDRAFELAQRYFKEIPNGPTPPRVTWPDVPAAHVERRLLLEDQVELPRLYLAWPAPALFAPGDAELDVLGEILAAGKSSRLYRQLVHDRRIAVDVGASQASREHSGVFSVVATAAPGHSLSELEAVVADELARMAADGPSDDEVERARTTVEADFVYRLQTVGGFGGKADQLNAYNVFKGNPDYFDADLTRYTTLDAERIRAAAATYLRVTERVALGVVPRGQAAPLALAGATPVKEVS